MMEKVWNSDFLAKLERIFILIGFFITSILTIYHYAMKPIQMELWVTELRAWRTQTDLRFIQDETMLTQEKLERTNLTTLENSHFDEILRRFDRLEHHEDRRD